MRRAHQPRRSVWPARMGGCCLLHACLLPVPPVARMQALSLLVLLFGGLGKQIICPAFPITCRPSGPVGDETLAAPPFSPPSPPAAASHACNFPSLRLGSTTLPAEAAMPHMASVRMGTFSLLCLRAHVAPWASTRCGCHDPWVRAYHQIHCRSVP